MANTLHYVLDWHNNNVIVYTQTLYNQLMVGASNRETGMIEMLRADGWIVRNGSRYKVGEIKEMIKTIGTNFLPII